MRISNTGERNISFYSNKYNIDKNINGKSISFARFNTLEDAINYRNYCIANDWNIEKCKITKNTKTNKKYKYIYKLMNGSYQIRKNSKHYGIFNNVDDAIKHRDFCVANNWNDKCVLRKRKKYNKYNLPKYITYSKSDNKYVVCKWFKNGYLISYFNTLEDAVKERDILIKVNWDEVELIHFDEAFGSFGDGDYCE